MLAYFPEVYPDELLYSLLSRFQRHLGSPSPMHIMEMLFGHRFAIASIDFQGFLHFLASVIPTERDLTAEKLIDTLTTCPYYLAFSSPSMQREIRQALCKGKTENIHLRLGLAAFRIPIVSRLKFCPTCHVHMLHHQGELYWRRSHQLPSVLVCPIHGCHLLESTVFLAKEGRHRFVAATPENCPPSTRRLSTVKDASLIQRLHQIAIRSADLLNAPPRARTCSEWIHFYQSQMLERGFARSEKMMNQDLLEKEFRSYFGAALHAFPHVLKNNLFEGDWLANMIRSRRSIAHPQYHLLLQLFFEEKSIIESPFGRGPWPCLNPLVEHQEDAPVHKIRHHNNHGKKVAVFSCQCGYVYTRYYDATTNKVGPPRFLKYGPMLEPALRKLVAEETSLRGISRTLHLDPKTVVRLSNEAGITTRWGIKEANQGTEHKIKRNLAEKIPLPKKSRAMSLQSNDRSPRRDWDAIDENWLDTVKQEILKMRKEKPLIRITLTRIECRTGGCGWLSKRRAHLPKTMEFLRENVETVEEFQVRRVRQIIDEQKRQDEFLRAWEVMRKAGLKSTSLEWIKTEIESSQGKRRTA